MTERQKVVVVGAGPVGALAALYAAVRGDDVEIYELRGDLRDPSTTPLNFTKSINLALSERGVNSMRQAGVDGLVDEVLKETIPMHARMIHGRNKLGDLYEDSQAYDVHGRSIHAVDRAGLNKRLLDSLEAMPNVQFFFNHKLTGADFKKNSAWFEHRSHPEPSTEKDPTQSSITHQRFPEIAVKFDLLIGADGAHSATRYHLMKYARVNYSQEYIDTLWCEFQIPPTLSSTFAISPHHLHIWPSPTSMFIAIPSLDKSFTCTLFAPSATFSRLSTSPKTLLPEFFTQNFPGVTPDLITTEALIHQYSQNPHLPLINIRCSPHHYSSSAVILGDAAHAMVPFYGQGMNAGLEDVRVLFDFLTAHNIYSPSPSPTPISTRRAAALAAYTAHRTPDAHAINALALRNYLEMRSLVTSRLYLLRKFIEEALYKYVPGLGWATQYSRVSFGNERYSEVERLARRQGRILAVWGVASLVGMGCGVLMVGVRFGLWGGRARRVATSWRMVLGSMRKRTPY